MKNKIIITITLVVAVGLGVLFISFYPNKIERIQNKIEKLDSKIDNNSYLWKKEQLIIDKSIKKQNKLKEKNKELNLIKDEYNQSLLVLGFNQPVETGYDDEILDLVKNDDIDGLAKKLQEN